MKLSILICLLLFAIFILCDNNVRYAAIIYNHGETAPVDPYPTDPWRDTSLWPVKFGELTNTGKNQQYALGLWLKARYSVRIFILIYIPMNINYFMCKKLYIKRK